MTKHLNVFEGIHVAIQKIVHISVVRKIVEYLYFLDFPGSQLYWENRYKTGRKPGPGSYGKFAEFKADVVNCFIKENDIKDVIEFGCGDGNVLSLINYPQYIGFDVSRTAIKLCIEKFRDDKSKSFFLYDSPCFADNKQIFRADLTISLDVLSHLVEDEIFDKYMKTLFLSSKKYVVIYSRNFDGNQIHHERDREFTRWIELNEPDWRLSRIIRNKYSLSDPRTSAHFYIFERIQS